MQEYRQTNVSVIEPVSEAIDRTKLILFSPFDMGKWFVMGFCAFLAYLGQGGGGNFNGFNSFGDNGNGNSTQEFQNFISTNLPLVIIIAAIIILSSIALSILLCWLSSRGRFMFLHCVAKNIAQVKAPWSEYKRQGNSLFLFRLSVGLIIMFVVAIFAVVIFLSAMLIKNGQQVAIGITIIVFLSMGLICVLTVSALTMKFTRDFVVPIMYLQKCRCVEAWNQFWPILTSNKGKFTLYILFQIVISMAVGAIVFAAFIATCCVACCLVSIPYIGAVATLPISVFTRSYSLYYLRQFSMQFNVFENIQEMTPE